MNRFLNEAIVNIGKADAIAYAIEECYQDYEALAEDHEMLNRATYAVCALRDADSAAKKSLLDLSSDLVIVDAVQAVNNIRES